MDMCSLQDMNNSNLLILRFDMYQKHIQLVILIQKGISILQHKKQMDTLCSYQLDNSIRLDKALEQQLILGTHNNFLKCTLSKLQHQYFLLFLEKFQEDMVLDQQFRLDSNGLWDKFQNQVLSLEEWQVKLQQVSFYNNNLHYKVRLGDQNSHYTKTLVDRYDSQLLKLLCFYLYKFLLDIRWELQHLQGSMILEDIQSCLLNLESGNSIPFYNQYMRTILKKN